MTFFVPLAFAKARSRQVHRSCGLAIDWMMILVAGLNISLNDGHRDVIVRETEDTGHMHCGEQG